MQAMRLEHDLLGEREVPNSAYWGIHTLRAIENFPISGVPIGHYRSLVRAFGFTKEAAAIANRDLGALDPALSEPIIQASIDVQNGLLDAEFVVDAIQGGACGDWTLKSAPNSIRSSRSSSGSM